MADPISSKAGVVLADTHTEPPEPAPDPVAPIGGTIPPHLPTEPVFQNEVPTYPPQETFVVPANGVPPQSNAALAASDAAGTFDVPEAPQPTPAPAPVTPDSSFVPQGVIPDTGVVALQQPPSHASNPLPRRILMIVVFLLLAAGLIGGGMYFYRMLGGTKEVTITYWGLWENDATVQGVLSDFEAKNPKIKVQYVKQSPRQYRERLQSAISREEGPDVFRFHNTWVAMLRSDLSLVPKTIMTAADFSSTFYPVASADLVAGQNIFGIPLMIEGLGLYYNEDLFAAAGVTAPTTWEDVLNIVPKLTVKKDNAITTSAIALGTTGNVENWSDILATMMMQNGAKLTQPTSKEAEETLIFFRKFANPADPVYTWNETLDNSIYAFAIGKVAMILAPSWRAFDIKEISSQANPNIRFKIIPIPQLPGNTITWASYWVEGVSGKSKRQEEAWKFVQFLTSRETATKLYTEAAKTRLFGEPYARLDLASAISEDPYAGAFVKQAQSAKSFPLASRTFDNGLNDKMIKYFEDAVNAVAQGTAPSSALQTAANGFRQILSQYGLISGSPAPTTP